MGLHRDLTDKTKKVHFQYEKRCNKVGIKSKSERQMIENIIQNNLPDEPVNIFRISSGESAIGQSEKKDKSSKRSGKWEKDFEMNPVNDKDAYKGYRMNLVVVASRILGLDPLLSLKDPWSWLSISCLLLWTSFSFYVFFYVLDLGKMKYGTHMKFTVIHLFSVMIFAALTLFQTKKNHSFAEKLTIFDRKFNLIGGNSNMFFGWKTRKFEIGLLLIIVGNIIPFLGVHKTYSFRVLFCYCRMVRDCQVALFLNVVYHLRQRFEALNRILEDALSASQYTDHRYLLRSLDGSHAMLRNCAQVLNYHSGLQVLLAMGLMAISDVASFTTKFDYYSDLKSFGPKVFDGWFLFLKAFYFILLVIVSCDVTEHQANLTASIVHKVGNTFTAEGLEKQVIINSVHLLHDKVKFAALGLIPLNITLLAAMGTLAMDPQYLVALGFSLPAPTAPPGFGPPPPRPPRPPPFPLFHTNKFERNNTDFMKFGNHTPPWLEPEDFEFPNQSQPNFLDYF